MFAITLVVFAILVSAVRYSLPYLNDQKHYIEEYVFSQYGVQLYIGSIDAKWQGSGPQLVLQNVSLPQSDVSPIELSIKDIYVHIEFWESLLNQRLVSKNFNLDGLALRVNVQQIEASDNDFPIIDALEGLFLEQLKVFSVTDSTVSIVTKNTSESVNIESLSWLNKGTRHQGQGRLQIAELANNSAYFVIDLYTVSESINGTVYAKAEALDISPWFNEFSQLQSQLKEGRGNFEVWGQIKARQLTKINGSIKPSQFVWQQGEAEFNSSIDGGTFSLIPNKSDWLFSVNALKLNVLGNSVSTSVNGKISADQQVSLSLGKVTDIAPFIEFASRLNPNTGDTILNIAPTASLTAFDLQINPQRNISISASLDDISWLAHNKIPGVNKLSADLYWHDDVLNLAISGESIQLTSTNIFDEDLLIDRLEIPIKALKHNESWEISADAIQLSSQTLNIESGLHYTARSNELSAFASIPSLTNQALKKYLPSKILGQKATGFLTRAFNENGRVESATALWQGELGNFPFDKNDGVFLANMSLKDSDFVFSSQWPQITNMDIDLNFVNNDLMMEASKGNLDSIALSNVNARIPVLSKSRDLIIEADIAATGTQVSRLMLKSSLSDSLGKLLSEDLIIDKQLEANLSLYVPLDSPADTSASGRVKFNENSVLLSKLDLKLESLEGELRFTDDSVKFNDMAAFLFKQPITIDYNSAVSDEGYRLDAIIEGKWDVDKTAQLIAQPLTKELDGEINWNGVVNATIQKEAFDYAATIFSSLKETNSSLPFPFATEQNQSLPLRIVSRGNNQASNLSVSLGDDVQFDGILPHKEKQFSRAHLALGKTDFIGLGLGLSISANLPQIDVLPWYQTIDAVIKSSTSSKKPVFPQPSRLFIETDTLVIAQQPFNDVDMVVKNENGNWLLDLNSDETKANITFYQEWLERGIKIEADFLRIDEFVKSDGQTKRDFEPQILPPIYFTCRQCEILSNKLGEVRIETFPNDDGMRIDKIFFNGEHGVFDADGQWYKRNGDHYTFINGDLESNDFGAFLKDFKFDSGIKDSEADIDFAITWKNSPLDFTFSELDGELQWNLSDGYLTELSDKGSRIFTLLSLESLVRKLSLDFRDVFAKGFFYDNMEGTIQITQGKADTRDTIIDGGAGEMTIYGYTDLDSRELNYNVSFTPKVTGNLPVLIYFMVNPPTAIAALALDQVLTSTKVISNVNYSITGTLDEPILLETGRDSTEVELPARRDIPTNDEPFIPPTVDDTITIEVDDS
ncbi:protease [Glaciecola sp. KUL10]|nr:protease [Glaciecola sp. KUL10]